MQTNLYFLSAMAILYIVLILGSFPQDESVIGLLNLPQTCWTNWHNVATNRFGAIRDKEYTQSDYLPWYIYLFPGILNLRKIIWGISSSRDRNIANQLTPNQYSSSSRLSLLSFPPSFLHILIN